MCKSCELRNGGCEEGGCYKANFLPLYPLLSTPLPKLWKCFEYTIAISQRDHNGLVTLSGLPTYLSTCPPLNVTHDDFYEAMAHFLDSTNLRIIKKRKNNKYE